MLFRSLFTLLPKNNEQKKYAMEHCKDKTHKLITFSILIVVISLLFNLIATICNLSTGSPYKLYLNLLFSDMLRIIVYSLTFLISKFSRYIQSASIALYFLFFSILITEMNISNGAEDFTLGRVLSTSCLFILISQYTVLGFAYSVIPIVISLSYPFIRNLGKY